MRLQQFLEPLDHAWRSGVPYRRALLPSPEIHRKHFNRDQVLIRPYPELSLQGDSPAPEHLESVRGLPAPGDALRFARNTRDVWRTDWFEVNIRIMEAGLYLKFTQHDVLKALLLSTGTRKLVEDSPRDDFWGIGKRGDGRNELGKVLMRIRERIVREEA